MLTDPAPDVVVVPLAAVTVQTMSAAVSGTHPAGTGSETLAAPGRPRTRAALPRGWSGAGAPEIVAVDRRERLAATVADETRRMVDLVRGGNVAVVVPDALAEEVSAHLIAGGNQHGRAATSSLDIGVTVVPVSMVKGLELDGVVVVEPADIVDSELHGLRALYVALTRSTQRLSVVHHRPLPASMTAS